jgi:hypothetical protein
VNLPLILLARYSHNSKSVMRTPLSGNGPHLRVRRATCLGNLRSIYSDPLSDHSSAVNFHMNKTRSAAVARTKLSPSLENFFNVDSVRIIFMFVLYHICWIFVTCLTTERHASPADESRPVDAIVRLLFKIILRQEIQGLQDLFFCQLPVY